MSNTKLNFNKFRISKLTNTKRVVGGATTDGGTTLTKHTEEDSPPDPVCILGSKEFVEG